MVVSEVDGRLDALDELVVYLGLIARLVPRRASAKAELQEAGDVSINCFTTRVYKDLSNGNRTKGIECQSLSFKEGMSLLSLAMVANVLEPVVVPKIAAAAAVVFLNRERRRSGSEARDVLVAAAPVTTTFAQFISSIDD